MFPVLLDLCEQHPCFLIAETGTEEASRRVRSCSDEDPIIAHPVREDCPDGPVCLRVVLPEPIRHREDDHLPDMGALGPEF